MSKKYGDIIWIKNQYGLASASNKDNLKNVKELLDSTGSGFCIAKFTQTTLHLGNGTVHSCHHPSPHKIPLSEIEQDHAALFNTEHLKQARREMLTGEKPGECDYCWRIEDNGNYSDRHFKSLEPWAISEHDRIVESDPSGTYYPKYLEVDFSNVCNLRCTYCGPEFSSTWVENLKRHGPIKLLENTSKVRWAQGWQDLDNIAYRARDDNPYVTAFWSWFPEAYKHLKVYRITGGEPLLSKETFKSMDWFMQNPNTDLEFSINSNLCVPDKLWDQFIEKLQALLASGNIARFTMFTSVDAWGKQAEYARPGLDFELFKKRYEQLLEIGNIRAIIMCTFNIFSITSIEQLFRWHVALKRKYNSDVSSIQIEKETGFNIGCGSSHTLRHQKNPDHYSVASLDIPYLRHPEYLDAIISSDSLVQDYLIPAMNFVSQNSFSYNSWGQHQGFETNEVEKFKRIVLDRMYLRKNNNIDDTSINTHRAQFYDFVNEQDRRNGSDFLATFPEMTEFYNLCKRCREDIL